MSEVRPAGWYLSGFWFNLRDEPDRYARTTAASCPTGWLLTRRLVVFSPVTLAGAAIMKLSSGVASGLRAGIYDTGADGHATGAPLVTAAWSTLVGTGVAVASSFSGATLQPKVYRLAVGSAAAANTLAAFGWPSHGEGEVSGSGYGWRTPWVFSGALPTLASPTWTETPTGPPPGVHWLAA